jgi:hypothetical protein
MAIKTTVLIIKFKTTTLIVTLVTNLNYSKHRYSYVSNNLFIYVFKSSHQISVFF